MKYLNTTRLARITIQAGPSIDFIVPVELAALVFLFLASGSARLVALVTYCIARDLVRQYQELCHYLAGWRDDLFIIRLAILDLVGVPVEGYAT